MDNYGNFEEHILTHFNKSDNMITTLLNIYDQCSDDNYNNILIGYLDLIITGELSDNYINDFINYTICFPYYKCIKEAAKNIWIV